MHTSTTKLWMEIVLPNHPVSQGARQVEALQREAAQARYDEYGRNLAESAANLRRFGTRVAAALHRLVTWPARARAMAELNELNDRELADIGLTRADIRRVAG
ncbi:DUF1127 domain-containing protein [Roseomonas sp. NAR14]|uniref:DUF1127 domain-containing protein n=1 Tax=Roseomonas acroporae TaxID=2937791 RepID=A0A9X1YD28_9PROT|nr:DUF1127 domain-containing protein [Roseomonas acroporae]MCK8787540.1 DUF1127 domain-containing protein [Roseomonas acroporae]